MACAECKKLAEEQGETVLSWTALPMIDLENVPDDIDLICGSDKELKSWRIPASFFLKEIAKNALRIEELEQEIQILKEKKNGS